MHITQSAVSRQLAQRDLCGDPLLIFVLGTKLVPTNRDSCCKGISMTCWAVDHLLDDKPFDPQDWQGELVLAGSYVAQYLPLLCPVSKGRPISTACIVYMATDRTAAKRLMNQVFTWRQYVPQKPDHVSSIKLGEDRIRVFDEPASLASNQP
ncbi:LysR family transcriptional regulator [Vibrio lentus]|nr:LysR family transcriptional regulator [Vibrio lentus]